MSRYKTQACVRTHTHIYIEAIKVNGDGDVARK